MKVFVEHAYYGCDTGCCGHVFTLERDDGTEVSEKFSFSHPYDEDHRKWAEEVVADEFGAEHVKDLNWDDARVLED